MRREQRRGTGLITLWRIILAGTRNFFRNAWLSTAATAVMTVTLTIIVVSFISSSALSSTIKGVTDKIDISIYLKDSVTTEEREALRKQLESLENVQSVRYISKTDALRIYRADNADNPLLLSTITEQENPLPASFAIKSKDPKRLQELAAFANRPEIKALQSDPPSYSEERKKDIDKIVRVADFFKTTGMVGSVIFVIISTLIIFNTIRMAIFTRREEIEIMKLVGATKWFIRGPFVFEACLYGIIAAVIAVALSYGLLLGSGDRLVSYLPDAAETIAFFRENPLLIIGTELAIGVMIGALSSMLAMSRYLKL